MACSEENPMAVDENAVADRVAGDGNVDHGSNSPDPGGDMDLSGEEHAPKARKPYTITKQREKWTEDEHRRFLEALQLHGRAWRRIQEHIGTKTAVQIRSHAQKFFTKVVKESTGSDSVAIQIPPPRPKRKPAHPYPRKVDGAGKKKHAPALKQLEPPPPPPPMLSAGEQDDGSPTSVLTAAHTVLRADAVVSNNSIGGRSPAPSAAGSDGHGNGAGSPASSVDRDGSCLSPRIETATEPDMRARNTKASGDGKVDGSVFKLFGKKVVVKASDDMLSFGAAEGSSWNPWPSSMQQLVYFLPRPDSFAAQSVVPWLGYNGGLPCALFYPQQAVASSLDRDRLQREGSLTGSNSPSSVAAPASASAAVQNADAAESRNGQEQAAPAVPRLAKLASSASFSGRGFVPYKRCAAESEAPRPAAAPGEEADGELTRLCL